MDRYPFNVLEDLNILLSPTVYVSFDLRKIFCGHNSLYDLFW